MGTELFEALVADWTYMVKKALVEKPPLSNLPQSTEAFSSLDSPLKNCGPPDDVIYSSTPATTTFKDELVTEKSNEGPENADELPPLFRAPTTTMRN